MKRLYSLTVRGNQHQWSFETLIDPKYVDEWRRDGLEIDEVCNTIPEWIAGLGLTRIWSFFQDIFYFKNPFR